MLLHPPTGGDWRPAISTPPRRARDAAPASARRATIHAALSARGGAATAGELGRALGMERKTAEYHLHCLVRLGHARVHRATDGVRRFSTQSALAAPDLRDQVLACVRARPGLSTSEIARGLGVSHTRVDRRVKDLVLEGLVESTPQGGTRRIFPRAA